MVIIKTNNNNRFTSESIAIIKINYLTGVEFVEQFARKLSPW